MATEPSRLATLRESYGCDCDERRRSGAVAYRREDQAAAAWAQAVGKVVREVTGVRCDTCPWRGFYDPLVIEAIEVAALSEKGLGLARLGEDPPAILLDALAVYLRAREASSAYHMAEWRKSKGMT